MTETPQIHTFRATTSFDEDAFADAPTAIEYKMSRKEAVSLVREANALLATSSPTRCHDIPTEQEIRWLQLPLDGSGDLDAATDCSEGFVMQGEFFRLTHTSKDVAVEVVGREKHIWAEVFSEITTPRDLIEKFQITDAEAQPQMHLVQGTDFSVPGKITVICPTMELARNHALDLTNTIRQGVGLAPVADADKYEEALQEAREARADELGCDVDDPDMAQADVWIEEIPVMTTMPRDIMALRADPAANRQRSRPR